MDGLKVAQWWFIFFLSQGLSLTSFSQFMMSHSSLSQPKAKKRINNRFDPSTHLIVHWLFLFRSESDSCTHIGLTQTLGLWLFSFQDISRHSLALHGELCFNPKALQPRHYLRHQIITWVDWSNELNTPHWNCDLLCQYWFRPKLWNISHQQKKKK